METIDRVTTIVAFCVVVTALVASAEATAATETSTTTSPRHKAVASSAVRKTASKAADARIAQQRPPDYRDRADVRDYIDRLVVDEHFDRDALTRLFADAHYSATAARLMTPTATTGVRRDWNTYRARFVEPVRLGAGFDFWEANAALLERAERDFGVPAEIIVGILGVETVYGRNTGSFRVIDALTTLAFDFPRNAAAPQRDRSAFFRDQLTDALRMDREGAIDLSTLRGSYAGAIGMPQFMPGSIRADAIDYDGDGRIDLVGSPADIVGSVAHFLAQHGWVRDLTVYLPLNGVAGDARQQTAVDAMVEAGSVPTFSYADFAAAGLSTTASVVEPLALIDLPSGADASGRPRVAYLAGTQNFHAITRYNRSYFYAYSVIELGGTIKALRDARHRATDMSAEIRR